MTTDAAVDAAGVTEGKVGVHKRLEGSDEGPFHCGMSSRGTNGTPFAIGIFGSGRGELALEEEEESGEVDDISVGSNSRITFYLMHRFESFKGKTCSILSLLSNYINLIN